MRKNKVKYEELQNLDYRGNGWPGGMQITKKGEIRFLFHSFQQNIGDGH